MLDKYHYPEKLRRCSLGANGLGLPFRRPGFTVIPNLLRCGRVRSAGGNGCWCVGRVC